MVVYNVLISYVECPCVRLFVCAPMLPGSRILATKQMASLFRTILESCQKCTFFLKPPYNENNWPCTPKQKQIKRKTNSAILRICMYFQYFKCTHLHLQDCIEKMLCTIFVTNPLYLTWSSDQEYFRKVSTI